MHFFLSLGAFAATLTPQDAIKSQAGCFKVTFQYKETKVYADDYKRAKPKRSEAIEWVSIEHDEEYNIILQHVLVSGPAMIRHWKQEWIYEPRTLLNYTNLNQWSHSYYFPSETNGAWGQIVYNVDDAPRYECLAEWTNTEEENYWTCQTWAPLPRRESKRDDYNILERTNTHRILDNGWVHQQDNTKVLLLDGQRTDIVSEQGYNTYERVSDDQCQKAIDWWPTQQKNWIGITNAWEQIRSEHETFQMESTYRGIPLWIRLFKLAKKSKRLTTEETTEIALEHIQHYLILPE